MSEVANLQSGKSYFVPDPNMSPVIINLGLFLFAGGMVFTVNDYNGVVAMVIGIIAIGYGTGSWLYSMAVENAAGKFTKWEDRSFRIGMAYYIAAEMFFIASFLFALFWMRTVSVPALGGMEALWPGFEGTWPSGGPMGGKLQAFGAVGPAVGMVMLVISAMAINWGLAGMRQGNRGRMNGGLVAAVILASVFLTQQSLQLFEAATLGVTVASAYGTNFFALTVLHMFHLIMGVIMMLVVQFRMLFGHFDAQHHAGLELVSWYWNFAVVVPGVMVFLYFYWM